MQSLLSTGKTSRLYKNLIEGKAVASEVGSSNSAGRYPGWFTIQVQLLPDKDRDVAEGLVLAELELLQKQPVSEAELNRVKQSMLADIIFSRETVHGLADSIARGVMTNDTQFLRDYLPNIMNVTAPEIQKAAQKYLDPKDRVVVWSDPKARRPFCRAFPEERAGERRGIAAQSAPGVAFSAPGTATGGAPLPAARFRWRR